MASYDQNPTMHRGSTSPVHSLANVTSANAPQYSHNPPNRPHYDNYMRTGVPKEDPVLRSSSTDPATKESRPPPVPPKDGLYQLPPLFQQTRIEDYKPPLPVAPIDAEQDGPAPQDDQPVIRESLSSEPELSSRETRRPRAASSTELNAPRPPPRSISTPTLRRRRTSRERDDGGCRLTSPPPGLREYPIPCTCQLLISAPLFQFDRPLFGETSPVLLSQRPISHPSSEGRRSSPQEYRLTDRCRVSLLSVSKRAAYPLQSSSLRNSSDCIETSYIRRPLYTLSLVSLFLGGFLVVGVAPAAAHASPQQAGIDPTQTTSSFNWWPYPSWGASSLSAPVLMTAISTTLATTQSTVASASTDPVISSSSSPGTASIAGPVTTTTEETAGTTDRVGTTVQITAISPSASIPSQGASTATPRSGTFKPIYLLPVTILGGAILGACVTALIYSRCYSVRKPLLGDDLRSAGFPANRGYHGVEEWGDEEDKRGGEEKHFIAQPDDSDDDFRAGGGGSSKGRPRGYNFNHLPAPVPVPGVARDLTQYSNQCPESGISKAKSGFSRARTTRTRVTEHDDVDSWYARKSRKEEDSIVGLSDEEPPSPYVRLSEFRKPRATTSGFSGQELLNYEQDDPARSLLPSSVDRPGVFRRRVTPIHMRGHGRSDSNTVTQDVLRVPDKPLEGKLLPPSPASVYPDEDSSLQKETPSLPHSSDNPPPWSSGYRRYEDARVLSPPPSQLVYSNHSFSDPPGLSTVSSGDSLDLNLVLEDERGPRVPPKRSRAVHKDFSASVSTSSTFIHPPSRLARKHELDSQQTFSKLNTILRRSWDQRGVGDRPSSPTGFGAIIDDQLEVQRPLYGARPMRRGETGQGQVNFGTVQEGDESIEQRLANLRRKDNRFDRM